MDVANGMHRVAGPARSAGSRCLCPRATFALLCAAVAAAPAGATIGRVAGEFAVTATGGATYTVPIQVAAGMNGLRPSLALAYHSQAGDGLAGTGWTLAGLPEIARCPLTRAIDGRAQGVRFGAEDRFCLDGHPLVLVAGTHGADGAEYRGEVHAYERVFARGRQGTGPAWFEMFLPDGTVQRFGNDADSRIEAPGTGEVRAWGINEVEDRYRQRIGVRWSEDALTGEYAPAEVRWTYGPGDAFEQAPYRLLVEREPRPAGDVREGWTWGSPWRASQRLAAIDYGHDAGEGFRRVHRYALDYAPLAEDDAGRSQLARITQCGPTECLPPTEVAWDARTAARTVETITTIPVDRTVFGDVNGDGATDAFGAWNGRWAVWSANPQTGGFLAPVTIGGTYSSSSSVAVPLDYNGDGLTDLMTGSSQGPNWLVYLAPSAPGGSFQVKNTGVAFTLNVEVAPMDLDADGFDDLVYLRNAQVYVRRNLAGSLAPEQSSGLAPVAAGDAAFSGGRGFLEPADFDGDGRRDLLVARSQPDGTTFRWEAFLSRGTAFDRDPIASFTTSPNRSDILVLDVNGDGLTDVMRRAGTTAPWDVLVSRGTGTPAQPGLVAQACPSPITTTTGYPFTAIDLDGDGRHEFLTRAFSGGWRVHRAEAGCFSATERHEAFTGPSAIDYSRIATADTDGDGNPDVMFGSRTLNRWGLSRPAPALRPDGVTPVLRGGLVREIADGLGNAHGIAYRALTGWGGYSATGAAILHARLLRGGPLAVVGEWSGTPGRGDERFTVSLAYADARVSTHGRGFLGFGSVTSTDSRNGLATQTAYRQDFPYAGQVERTVVSGGGHTVSVLDPTWASAATTVPDAARDAHFVYLAGELAEDYEVDAVGGLAGRLVRSRTRTLAWNLAHGAVASEQSVVTSPLEPGRSHRATRAVGFDAAPAAQSGCLALPARVDVTRESTGAAALTRSTRFTWDPATCRMTTRTEGPADAPASQLVTAFAYDALGRPASVARADGAASLPARLSWYRYETSPFRPSAEGQVIAGEPDLVVGHAWDDGLGVATARTSAQGTTTAWQHDEFGRRTAELRPRGGSTFEYAACGPCFAPHARYTVRETRSDGHWTETQHDGLGRVVGRATVLLDGGSSRQVIEHDALGRVARESVPHRDDATEIHWTRYAWDLRDRPTGVEEPGGGASQIVHAGLARTVRDAEGRATTYVHDAGGRLVAVQAPLGGGATYAYDSFDALTAITDAAGHARQFAYDARGLLVSSADPDAGRRTYAWNAFGEVASQADGRDPPAVVTHDYDQLGRLVRRVEPEGTTAWTYYATPGPSRGLLQQVAGPLEGSAGGFRESYVYGPVSRLRQQTTVIDDTSYVTDYAWDVEGKLTSMLYPATVGWRPSFRFAWANGHLAAVTQENPAATPVYSVVEMDAQGRDVRARFGNGAAEARSTFDPASGRLSTLRAGVPPASADVQDYSYEWDRVGNLVARRDLGATPRLEETFTYDALDRLTGVALNGAATLAMTYTADGNVATKSDAGSFAYGSADRLPHAVTRVFAGPRATAVIGYDANGNMTSGHGRTIAWTSYNLPREIVRGADYARFAYGPTRQRVRQESRAGTAVRTTHYVGPHFEVEIEGGARRYRSNVFAYGRAVYSQVEHSAGGLEAYHLLHDHQGSVDRLVRAAGAGADRLAQGFDAWGKRRNADWSADPADQRYGDAHFTERGYTGHEHLDGVRLVHMNGRVEDPVLGRMLSPDPMLGSLASPQGLNPYGYVANGPLSYTDPSGFFLKRIGKFFKRLFRHVGSFGRRLLRRWGRQIAAVAAAWFAGGVVSGWAQGAQLGDIGVSIGAGGLAAEGIAAATTLTASVPASTVLGGIAGGAIAGAISSGSLSGAGMGALSGGVTAGIGGYYGGGYGAGRVLAEAAVGGATSEISGGDFAKGALVSGGLSALTWASLEMRRVMIEQSRINPENAAGLSAGFRNDVFKLGGSRWPSSGSPLGGVQGGRGNVFGIDYGPGSFLDHLVETYAGPHDFLNSPLFYDELGNNLARPAILEVINAANVLVATPFAGASVVPSFAYGALGD